MLRCVYKPEHSHRDLSVAGCQPVLCCVQAAVTAAATYGDADKVKGLISGAGGPCASGHGSRHHTVLTLPNPVHRPVLPTMLQLCLSYCLHPVLQCVLCDADNVTFEQFAEAFAKPSQVSHQASGTPSDCAVGMPLVVLPPPLRCTMRLIETRI